MLRPARSKAAARQRCLRVPPAVRPEALERHVPFEVGFGASPQRLAPLLDVVVEDRTDARFVQAALFFPLATRASVNGRTFVPQFRLERPAAPVHAEVLAVLGRRRGSPEKTDA